MTKISANKAAAEVRSKILRKMNQLEDSGLFTINNCWRELRTYIKRMAPRASAKKGGLGKR